MKQIYLLFSFLLTFVSNAQTEFIIVVNSNPPNTDFTNYNNQSYIIPLETTLGYTYSYQEVDPITLNPRGSYTSTVTVSNTNFRHEVIFPTIGFYRIKISSPEGNLVRFSQISSDRPDYLTDASYLITEQEKLFRLEQWGNFKWTSFKEAFMTCFYLDVTATDIPDLSLVSNFNAAFAGCHNLIFNTSINNWNMQNATDLSLMFKYCKNFNQPLNSWNVSNVIDMNTLFYNCVLFDQPLNNWNVAQVNNMSSMFLDARNFNQNINNWNVGQVTDMSAMFQQAKSFNQPLNNWDVREVTSLYGIFANAINFNQPLNDWKVSKVSNMSRAFSNATNFNQPLNNWQVSQVVNMEKMFIYATMFNQSLESWNIESVTNLIDFFNNSGIDCVNYYKTLNAWSNNSNTPITLQFGASYVKYGEIALEARRLLSVNKRWQIIGDILDENYCLVSKDEFYISDLKIYPNPVIEFLHIESSSEIKEIEIYSLEGKLIRSQNFENKINLSKLQGGTYILKLIDYQSNFHQSKFIKK